MNYITHMIMYGFTIWDVAHYACASNQSRSLPMVDANINAVGFHSQNLFVMFAVWQIMKTQVILKFITTFSRVSFCKNLDYSRYQQYKMAFSFYQRYHGIIAFFWKWTFLTKPTQWSQFSIMQTDFWKKIWNP